MRRLYGLASPNPTPGGAGWTSGMRGEHEGDLGGGGGSVPKLWRRGLVADLAATVDLRGVKRCERLPGGPGQPHRGVGSATPGRSLRPARYGRDEPAARRAGRTANLEIRRQRRRRSRRHSRYAHFGRADERRGRRRSFRDRLCRQRAQTLRSERERHGAPPRHRGRAKHFRPLQAQGADGFYKGDMAKALVAKSTAMGGTMTLADLAAYKGEWVDLTHTTYHGHDLYELPPPSQAWAALEMVNVLEACV